MNQQQRPAIQTTTNSIGIQEDEFIINTIDEVPSYVLEYAPVIHLNSKEPFWPASLEEHLRNISILQDDKDSSKLDLKPSQDNPCSILSLPEFNHERCFLTSTISVKSDPLSHPWLVSRNGIPDDNRKSQASTVILILVDKSSIVGKPGTIDAFWFFFYSFNLGPTIANIHFGNHMADWEHCMMRFENGKPQAVHLSAHADGHSYTYECLEKIDHKRPLIFSALGSHALYCKPGTHDYSPVKIVGPSDHTDRGPLWDPVLNYAAFQHYPSPARDKFRAIDPEKDGKLIPCLKFRGQWGDQFSSPTINPQKKLGGGWLSNINLFQPMKRTVSLHNLRWGDGVTGPRDKDLDRPGMNRFGNRIHTSI
ncbi:hypothetical protein MJO28_002977 [Puccinia striiformis f. sp. tritici]|uniref:Uncharacterized protein n=1 Tax=Puccinia striiformis f. sp. tritici TaxID=168172 RepID=A0ACC0ER55_9BASI|nr:hypothetical protein Pst134EA_005085 [Puccinia striiformis f. sp. tritici]KAH9471177.1 hypothetical protein Pst134EA_005085 [Puccinia striiformis f. sp. tritici]KAI7959186.1 hypothetical protein MJO28_002977 [Puccinia striiformis f. sp. tritici]KAI7964944.1 hypothetical protein MJO29_003042 [Puccinia striiformis f. sp. tritici]